MRAPYRAYILSSSAYGGNSKNRKPAIVAVPFLKTPCILFFNLKKIPMITYHGKKIN
jgi:hypothetical protein